MRCARPVDIALLVLANVLILPAADPACGPACGWSLRFTYSCLGDRAMAQSSPFLALVERQTALLRHYRAGAFAEALKMIDDCQVAAEAAGWQQGYYAMMRARIDGLIHDAPQDWTGVYVAEEK